MWYMAQEGRREACIERRSHAIDAQALTRRFGNFTAVDAITFHVEPGEVFGFLGANGAGKTTAIRMLIGVLEPTSGSATVAGYDLKTQAEQVRRRIGYMSQKFSLYEDLTVQENITLYGGIYGVSDRDIVDPHRRHPHPDRPGERRGRAGAGDPARLEAAARLLRGAAAPARRGLPRRADRRGGSDHPAAVLGADLRGRRRGHQRAGHHPLPGRGGVLPAHLHHGERGHRRHGHPRGGAAARWAPRRWTRCSSSSPGRERRHEGVPRASCGRRPCTCCGTGRRWRS